METESQEEDTDIVSINSVYINKKTVKHNGKIANAGRKNVVRSLI